MPTPFVNPIGAWQRTLSLIKKLRFFLFLCFLCLFYCLYANISPAPHGELQPSDEIPGGCDDGVEACICPREAICATNISQMIYLIIAKGTIYFLYPFIIITFLTKARNLVALLQKTIFSVFIDFGDTQWIHSVGGRILGVATWIHVVFHFIRWGARGELSMLTEHITGKTGLVAISLLPLIVWPMAYEPIKKRISFETRKALHYLSWIWGLALVFHAPAVHIFWIMGIVMLIYFLDYFVGLYSRIFLVESTIFRRLGNQTVLSFRNPEGFGFNRASYVYIMLPWISQYQWHAFSVFPHPTEKNTSSLCMAAVGNWTKELHSQVARPTARPAWICGPFLSPFASAIDYDHIITVASGIGITPALAVLDRLKDTRRVNLIWSCRDTSLVEFIVNSVEFPPDAFIFIFYTGKKKLNLSNAPFNVLVFEGRPNLKKVIVSMIHRIETNTLLPEEIIEGGQAFRNMDTNERGEILIHRIANEFDCYDFFDAASIEMPDDSDVENSGKHSKRLLLSKQASVINMEIHRRASATHRGSMFKSNLHTMQREGSHHSLNKRGSLVQKAVRRLSSAGNHHRRNSVLIQTKPTDDLRDRIVAGVNYDTFLGTIHDFFDGVFQEDEIKNAFDKMDANKDGFIEREEFTLFFKARAEVKPVSGTTGTDDIEGLNVPAYGNEWIAKKLKTQVAEEAGYITKKNIKESPNETSISTMAKSIKDKTVARDKASEQLLSNQVQFVLDSPELVATWKMLYCGGSAPIVNQLKAISDEFHIELDIEKFDW